MTSLIDKEFSTDKLRKAVSNGETSSLTWRKAQLKKIKTLVENHQDDVLNALTADLGKPKTEGFFELVALKEELKIVNDQLNIWIQQKQTRVPLWLKPGEAMVFPEPLGCILIIGTWNYPFMLTLQPLISALAAGNTAVVKPSEFAPATSALIKRLVSKYFSNDIVTVLEGDGTFTENILEQRFDHIFFTGGEQVAKKIMTSAAKYLTPITLELGGRNPAIVIQGADIDVTARRIIWGKSLNAGQTCLAPNHVLVEEGLKSALIKSMKKYIIDFYGENPLNSKDLAKINPRQFKRILTLLKSSFNKNKIIFGGDINENEMKISPTLINIDETNDPLLTEELFGPLLPILGIQNLNIAIKEIQNKPKPLAIYMFGGSSKEQELILNLTSSGGVCFNDVVIQAGIPELPFGGVGSSGMGRYHGKSGFDTFSNYKSVLKRPFWLDLNFRYPPYKIDLSILKKLLG